MDLNPITQEITTLLTTFACWFETFEHEPVRTSEEAARIRPGYSLRQGAKAIIIRAKKSEKDKQFVMLVFPADRKFDNAQVKSQLGVRDIRFANEQEISTLTRGIQPGGVPPFGNLFGLHVIADPTLFENEKIVFNAGDPRFSVAMRSEDYKRLVSPEIASITN